MTILGGSTYGPRPQSFTMDDTGERYYIGSEIGAYLRLHRGTLYKKYPLLWRKVATVEDKEKLRQIALSQAFMHTNIMLVKAHEIDELLAGQEEKYRAAGSTPLTPRVESAVPKVNKPVVQAGWMGQQVNQYYICFIFWNLMLTLILVDCFYLIFILITSGNNLSSFHLSIYSYFYGFKYL
uniref:SWI/SNF-related matrix-associated actin-dependent regulator of chromatin subfamily B member 1 n=1 Tax=Heterorhabditis bacteriophora TaxID=37862 RepID=A0A1I7XSJ6_HETBA